MAPDVFTQSELDGIGTPLTSEPPDEAMPQVREAILHCPVGAIRLVNP